MDEWWVQLLLVAAGAIGGALGRDWNQSRQQVGVKRESARALAACAEPILKSVIALTINLDKVETTSEAKSFFGLESGISTPQDITELTTKVRGNLPFDHETLDSWRQAESTVLAAQRLFDSLRSQTVLSGRATQLLAQCATLKGRLVDTKKALLGALAKLEPHCATDTVRRIATDTVRRIRALRSEVE
jgi:hypothetical protein